MSSHSPHDRDYIIDEVECLLSSGEWPGRIAARLHYRSASALEARLIKWGRHDLATRVHIEAVPA